MQIKRVSHSFDQYVTKQRWMSYHYQLKECLDSNSKSFLIIGKGDGIVPVILTQILEKDVLTVLKKYFTVERDYVVPENTYHWFLICHV